MLKATGKEIIPEELEARQAEARRDTAEGAYVIILEDSKRVKGEMAEVEKKISDGKKEIEDNKAEATKIQTETIEIKNSFRVEKQAFDEMKSSNEATLLELKAEIKKNQVLKNALVADVAALGIQIEKAKSDSKIELKEIEVKKEAVSNEVLKEQAKLEESSKALAASEQKVVDAKAETAKFEEEKVMLGKSVESLKNEIINKEDLIKIHNKTIADKLLTITEKESEIAVWDKKIEKKEAEYKELETKAFAILKREEQLMGKEQFIRDKFEKAGIPFDEQ